MKINKINHKLVSFFIGVGFITTASLYSVNYMNISNEMMDTNIQIENFKSQYSVLSNNSSNKSGKLDINTDLSFYMNNIFAYALLEDIHLEIKKYESKYSNTLALEIIFTEIKDKDKFKNFLQAMSYLGFVDNVTNKSITLHVSKFSINDAIKIINPLKEQK